MRPDAAGARWCHKALEDPQIGQAIALIHREPARPWTVAGLASEVAMSRSALAARFTALVGEPPMHYVMSWRMLVAHTWLKAEGATIAELAERLGYQSEAAFSRAFKRYMGISPGAVKRNGAAVGQGWAWASETAGQRAWARPITGLTTSRL
jgi:AraC-like DNA-binding protein